jgi:dTDP-4-dehydrorhamnose reductase
VDQKSIIYTGGNGLLAGEFKKNLPGVNYVDIEQFDISCFNEIDAYFKERNISQVIHAAAFTSPPKCDREPEKAIDANIIGTGNMVKACMKYKIKLTYICTDYVFKGDKGNYKEDDPVYPVNKYAWSKLGGECAVRMYDNSLIIRTTFGPNIFPYEKAFTDQWTSRESVSVIVKMIVKLLEKDVTGTFHVGGPRKTVYQYAKSLDETKDIKELSIHEIDFKVPADTSLDVSKYNILIK